MADEPPAIGASLKDFSPSQFARYSQLLDESIDMEPAQRREWLSTLELRDPAWAAYLQHLFASLQAREHSLLETHDGLARHLASVSQDDVLIGRQFGPYRVLSLLGHGGMGSVWLAERADGLFTRQVALKLVHPALISRVITERSVREREILASLNHPNIARLLDAGSSHDGQPFLALEYIAGEPLTTYCDVHRLSIRERLQLFKQVLSAVQYAHGHLVIHRDLKPSNILVTEGGHVYLLDFGIAKLLTDGEAKETELTRLGGRALTPDYAAPEQITGAPITTAADVYSLGVMLYELLLGERPYQLKRETRGALEEAILQADPVVPSRTTPAESAATARATTPRKLLESLEGDLDTIVVKALKKSPAERYQTAESFSEDIDRFLRGDIVLARPDSMTYRAVKFVQRHRAGIGVASILIISLVAGLAATSYEARVAARQRDEALAAKLRLQTQAAAARLQANDVPTALDIILKVLPVPGSHRAYTPEALSVFQEARAADLEIMAVIGHAGLVRSIAFSSDGARIITASYDGTAKIWDAGSGVELLRLSGHGGHVNSAAFSPDGRRIVTASADKTARIWDAATAQESMQLSGHTLGVETAEFSPDGSRIVTASIDKTARIWDAASGRQLKVLGGHSEAVSSARFSHDGGRIVTASDDKTARIWDAATGREIMVFKGHTDPLESGRFSPDGRRIVTTSIDQTARIWNVATGQEMMALRGHTSLLLSAEFSPDGLRVVTSSFDATARIWDAVTGREVKVLSGHGESMTGAAFSPDGKRVAGAAGKGTLRVWDSSPGRDIMKFQSEALIEFGAFSPDGAHVLTVGDDKMGHIWDVATGREVARLTGHSLRLNFGVFSADGLRAVTASTDQTAKIWDVLTGRELQTLKGHTDIVYSAVFSPDDRQVLTASQDKSVRLWNSTTAEQVLQLTGHTEMVQGAAFSPDGSHIASASDDRTGRIWDAATGRQLAVLPNEVPALKATFSPDGRQIVTSGGDGIARIWDVATVRELERLVGHSRAMQSAVFSPDGLRVLTSSYDGTARIWDAKTGLQLRVLAGHSDSLSSAAFSPRGDRILTTSIDKTARIWDARTPDIETQIAWSLASQFDSLSDTDRFQLGLSDSEGVRRWPAQHSKCDELAAAPYDPKRRAPGVVANQLGASLALEACAKQNDDSGARASLVYQHGRALMASDKFPDARRDFEDAIALGYRAARIDLARLLSNPASGILDLPRAILLDEQSWHDGMSVAAFDLGTLYEHGVSSGDAGTPAPLPMNETEAWIWYQRAADAGEPNALARFAARQDLAAAYEESPPKKTALQLKAFKFYAAAAERARLEDWPDSAWEVWRHRRATLARLLEREGMIGETAAAYSDVMRNAAPTTVWDRLSAKYTAARISTSK
jgi:WD40 repeat protein/serine/threonine protein kinase